MPLARRTTTAVLWLALLTVPALSNAQAIINTSRSNIKNIALQLEGAKDTTDLLSVEGGQLAPDITLIDTALGQKVRQLGKPKFEDVRITLDANLSPSLAAWVTDSIAGRGRSRTGSVVIMDDNDRLVQRVGFFDALITEISLPALDAGAKDPAYLTITVSPTRASSAGAFAPGTYFKGKIGPKQKAWLCSNFRVRFDDLNGGAAMKGKKGLNAVNVKLARMMPPPHPLDEADLEFTTRRWNNDPYVEDAQRILKGDAVDHTVSVDYLNDDGDLLFTLTRRLAVYKTTIETGEPGADVMRVSMVGNAEPMTLTWAKK